MTASSPNSGCEVGEAITRNHKISQADAGTGWQSDSIAVCSFRERLSADRFPMSYDLTINGKSYTVDVDGDIPLLWVLRDTIGLTGTKFGCGIAMCGACTVHVDGVAMRSCIMPVEDAASRSITTIEAVSETDVGARVQKAWLDIDVVQCGYCQSGQIMSAAALLAANPAPTDDDIDVVMAGNICRCGTYPRIQAAIKVAAGLPVGAR